MMRIEPLTTHPIVKLKPVENDNQKRQHQEDQQQKQLQHEDEKKDESPILHIDEII